MPTRDDSTRRANHTRQSRQYGAGGSSARSGSRSSARGAASSRGAASQRSAASQRGAGARSGRGQSAQRGRGGRGPQRQTANTGVAGLLDRLGAFLETLPAPLNGIPPIAVAIAAVVIMLLLVFAVIVPSCTRPAQPAANSNAQSSAAAPATGLVHTVGQAKITAEQAIVAASQVGSLETSSPKVQALVTLLGEEVTAKLIAQAKTNPEALWIAAHPDAYAFEGLENQYKLLKLAADEPLAVSFVRHYPAQYPMADAATDKELAVGASSRSAASADTGIPQLYQWDRRWGYTLYENTSFGLTGSGPTALAMVYQGLSGDTSFTPHTASTRAQEGGYALEGGETANAFFTEVGSSLGLEVQQLEISSSAIRDELSRGHVIIANLGPGFFTTTDHFFVLAGVADDGQIIVNDPFSATRSAQLWDCDLIAAESIALFSFEA